MDIIKEISEIQFSVASYEDIVSNSLYQVDVTKYTEDKKNTLYDNRSGALFTKICKSCKQEKSKCPGHFGHIELNAIIVHPLFFNHVVFLLKIICFKCSNLIISKEHLEFNDILKLEGEKRLMEISKKTKTVDKCYHCYTDIRQYNIKKNPSSIYYTDSRGEIVDISDEEIYEIFNNINPEIEKLLSSSPPRNFCLKAWPVLPTCCRPCNKVCGIIKEDDLTKLLGDIVKANKAILTSTNKSSAILNLKTKIENFCKPKKTGNNIGKTDNYNNICDTLKGKQGIIRMNLMGKRTDMCARTVIGPGPDLKINEVGIPLEISEIVSFPIKVSENNIDEIIKLIKNKKIKYITRNDNVIRIDLYMMEDISKVLLSGDIVRRKLPNNKIKNILIKDTLIELFEDDRIIRNNEDVTPECIPKIKIPEIQINDVAHRVLKNGDWILMNRQPTLHKGSMMAFKAVIKNQKTFTLNLATCKSFNADFDGDEMNAHFPQSIQSSTELALLSSTENCIFSDINGNPNIIIQQDALLGAYLMTKENSYIVDYGEYCDIIMVLSREFSYYLEKQKDIKNILKSKKMYFGKISMQTGKSIISLILPKNFYFKDEDIEIINGTLIKGELSKKYLCSGSSSLIKKINITCGLKECIHFLNDIQFVVNKWLTYTSFSIHIGDVLPIENPIDIDKMLKEASVIKQTIMNPLLIEAKIKILLSNSQDIGKKIALEDNNIVTTIKAGSKGDYFNLGQTKGIVGQQLIGGERILKKTDNGKRANIHFPKKNLSDIDEYHSRGFCSTGFAQGLSPENTNMLAHSMSGRQGICDTAACTNKCGYNQRKTIKHNEDCIIKPDCTVRDANDQILMLRSNGTGFVSGVNQEYINTALESIMRELNIC